MYLKHDQVVHHHSAFSFKHLALINWLLGITMLIMANLTYAEDNTHIRTLASSCAACHGTNGNSQSITPVLAGLDADYFSIQMLAFKSGERANSSTVMHHHASGLTEVEINALANFFSAQPRISGTPLKSQTLEKNDE